MPQICLFNAAPDTGNLGVTALCHSAISGLLHACPQATVSVIDHGGGPRVDRIRIGNADLRYQRLSGIVSRRLYRTDNLRVIGMAVRLGGLGNRVAQRILAADAIWDASGGDSFTDLYGASRFAAVLLPKRIALSARRPLLLLPQTYGPFRDEQRKGQAKAVVCRARAAWARDRYSFEVLQDLLGSAFDPDRHRLGVDLAFGLPAVEPSGSSWFGTTNWLLEHPTAVGLNVSGLLYHGGLHAQEQYGLKADYRELVEQVAIRLLEQGVPKLLLVPHVVTSVGHYESDSDACEAVLRRLAPWGGRVRVAPTTMDPTQVKWMIAQLDWFCGTRMHSAIAALSSGVPAAAIAYSDKTRGVFETCDLEDQVIDPRILSTADAVAAVCRSFENRRANRQRLGDRLPEVMRRAREQMDCIVSASTGPDVCNDSAP